MKEAAFCTRLPENKVHCFLCPHHCRIPEGGHGLCLTRTNVDGALIAANYLRPVSTAVDPIEKKPLYHFHPGSLIFSTGPNGCTFKCAFCQNHEIAQTLQKTRGIPLKTFIGNIVESKSIGIAYTYSEPFIWFETIMDVAPLVKERGLVNVMVTNGYMEPAPLAELLTVIDAMNIDIKSMNPEFYKRLCKGELTPVLRTCETVKKRAHLEITALLIPGENDSEDEMRALSRFIATNLGKDTPLHISRYFPRFTMTIPSTPPATLMRAWEIAHEHLDHVYTGNIASGEKSNTRCPACKTLLIRRQGYHTILEKILTGESPGKALCANCKLSLPIIL